jgi:UDP-2,3-diacylglucosamine pyrophosphatase LpxH
LKQSWFWQQSHNDVVQKVLRKARKGTDVIYIPGNHDDRIRDFCGVHFGGVVVARDAIHETVDGRRYLVTHGDEFDGVVLYHRWLAWAGDISYELLLKLNRHYNRARQKLGLPYWSISAHIKKKVKNAVAFIGKFEEAVAEAARLRGLDGVVCGHIHSAEIREFGGITYMNDGDWVESCTALAEHADGRIEIIDWAERTRQAADQRAMPALMAA